MKKSLISIIKSYHHDHIFSEQDIMNAPFSFIIKCKCNNSNCSPTTYSPILNDTPNNNYRCSTVVWDMATNKNKLTVRSKGKTRNRSGSSSVKSKKGSNCQLQIKYTHFPDIYNHSRISSAVMRNKSTLWKVVREKGWKSKSMSDNSKRKVRKITTNLLP